MMSRRVLGWVILGWAAVTWGGRIGLLADPGDVTAWIRIAGSLVAAAVAGWALFRPSPVSPTLLWVYAGITGLVWATSLVSVWTEPNAVGFRLIHTGLAAVSLALAGLAAREAARWPSAARA